MGFILNKGAKNNAGSRIRTKKWPRVRYSQPNLNLIFHGIILLISWLVDEKQKQNKPLEMGLCICGWLHRVWSIWWYRYFWFYLQCSCTTRNKNDSIGYTIRKIILSGLVFLNLILVSSEAPNDLYDILRCIHSAQALKFKDILLN